MTVSTRVYNFSKTQIIGQTHFFGLIESKCSRVLTHLLKTQCVFLPSTGCRPSSSARSSSLANAIMVLAITGSEKLVVSVHRNLRVLLLLLLLHQDIPPPPPTSLIPLAQKFPYCGYKFFFHMALRLKDFEFFSHFYRSRFEIWNLKKITICLYNYNGKHQ